MKELSIEEKAKAYDEALTKARNIVNSINVGLIGKDSFEAVFPELKESEDDKIKKDIIQCVKYSGDNFIPFYKSTVGDMISYLEKQGEQKPADKVDPKFKVGDWVVNNNGEPQLSQVTARSWPNSKIKRAKDYFESFINTATLDKQYHLWTIQDAKDGDVLTDNYGIYIFDRFDEYDKRCYICRGAYQYSQKEYENEHMICSVEAHPATKEQRDLLFQKMKEAGYEWDAEKKELKKIDQKKDMHNKYVFVNPTSSIFGKSPKQQFIETLKFTKDKVVP